MRWGRGLFFCAVAAAFCFMLLTAMTDPGGARPAPALTSAVRENGKPPPPAAIAPARPPGEARPLPNLRPNPARLFVARDYDPILARREAELAERQNRGLPGNRRRLKWDDAGWHREEVALVTAYCPCHRCCGSSASGVTSIGKDAWLPGVAADPLYLDYGTRVFVPGYGLSLIDDTGGAMRRHWRRNGLLHLDLRMTYHHEAKQWGRRYLRVKIYAN
ncbi:MAG: 3D domain-containing protein [Planctomycetota bacterium]|jgi:3D (Asp-Asp-Asp) domain-containing protein|nr:3D domain-containing protein [Planctomycetota bacterium]